MVHDPFHATEKIPQVHRVVFPRLELVNFDYFSLDSVAFNKLVKILEIFEWLDQLKSRWVFYQTYLSTICSKFGDIEPALLWLLLWLLPLTV